MSPVQLLQRLLADVPTYESQDILVLLPYVAAVQGALHTRMLALQHQAPQPDPQSRPDTDYLLNTEEVAQRLGISSKWIRENIDSLPFAFQLGRLRRYSLRGMEEWIAQQRAGD